MSLSVYLDNKQMNIFDPDSNQSFLSGVYSKPYWLIEFVVNRGNESSSNLFTNNNCCISAATANEKTYFTRSSNLNQIDNLNSISVKESDDNSTNLKRNFKQTSFDTTIWAGKYLRLMIRIYIINNADLLFENYKKF